MEHINNNNNNDKNDNDKNDNIHITINNKYNNNYKYAKHVV